MFSRRIRKLTSWEKCCLSLEQVDIIPFNNIEIADSFYTLKIVKVDKIADKIKINGIINICLSYKIQGMEQRFNTLSMPLKFVHYSKIGDNEGDVYPSINGQIEDILFILSKGKISAVVDLVLTIKIFEVKEINFITELVGKKEEEKSLIDIHGIYIDRDIEIPIRKEIPLAPKAAMIKAVKDIQGKIIITDKYLHQQKVILKGLIILDIIYETFNHIKPLELLSSNLEFTHLKDIENCCDGLSVYVDNYSLDIWVDEFTEDRLAISGLMNFRLYLTKSEELSIVSRLPELIEGVKKIRLFTEVPQVQKIDRLYLSRIIYTKETPIIKKILGGKIKRCYILQIHVQPDLVHFRGKVELQIDYQGNKNENETYQINPTVDFDRGIDIKGITKNMNIEVKFINQDNRIRFFGQGVGIGIMGELKFIVLVSTLVEKAVLVRE